MNKWFFYRTVNIVSSKFYFGIHKTSKGLNSDYSFVDKYVGSGLLLQRAIKKEGIENFKTEALFMFSDKNKAYSFEEIIVSNYFINRKDCYNIALGGNGGKLLEEGSFFGKSHSKESKDKMSESRRIYLEEGNAYTKEIREKISKATKGKSKNVGASNRSARKVIYKPTGKIFDTLMEAAEFLGINYNTAHSRVVRGLKGNKLNYI